MALVGIALPKCTWHSHQCGSKIFLPESNHPQENGREKQDFFQLLAHARALGHGVTSSIWQIIARQPQPHPRIQLSNSVVLKDFPCQVSRPNPAMNVDVIGMSQNQTPLG